MKNDIDRQEAYIKAWKDVKLSSTSRTRIEESLEKYVGFHSVSEVESRGVRDGAESRSIERVPQKSIFGISLIKQFRFNNMTAFILIAVLLGGGTSFAAEGAVPGDMLYPIKVEVNEEVKGALAFGSEAEARLQAKLVAERLKEAEELAAEGMLTIQVATDIEARMKAHSEAVRTESAKAEAEGNNEAAAEVRAELTATLESFAGILASFSKTATNTGSESLIIEVKNERDATVKAQATATLDLDGDTSILKVNGGADGNALNGTTSDENEGVETSTDIDVEIDTAVDTDLHNTGINSDTNVRTNTGIGL